MITINEIEVRSMITRTRIPAGDYVINPYIGCPHKCIYCYADYMRRFTNHREKWGDFLDVKRCEKKINPQRTAGKKIVLCSVTDAYNPFEKKFNVTRDLLKQFVNTGQEIEILTKSDLVLRDLDIFKQIPRIRIGISLNTLDDSIRKNLEPFASTVAERIGAVRRLNDEGIDTYLFLSPIFPGITDFREILTKCKNYTRMFYFENLNLRGAFRPVVLRYIYDTHRSLMPLYDEIYKAGNKEYWEQMEKAIDLFCGENNGLVQEPGWFLHSPCSFSP